MRSGVESPGRFSPLSRRLRLADELRVAREDQGRTQGDVAAAAGIDRTLLIKIEKAERRVRPDQIMRIVEALGIEQHTERWQDFYALARDADTPGWWEGRTFKGMGARQALIADLEAGASVIRWYDFALIPGLLQSPAYIRARHDPALAHSQFGTGEQPVSIRARQRRQAEVFKPGGPHIHAVLEEMVIRRLMVPKPAMLEQLRHLLTLTDEVEQLDVRVLPVGGELPGLRAPRSPWHLYEFATGDPPAALVEALTADDLLRGDAQVAYHSLLWERLHEMALPKDQTRELIADAADALSRELEPA